MADNIECLYCGADFEVEIIQCNWCNRDGCKSCLEKTAEGRLCETCLRKYEEGDDADE